MHTETILLILLFGGCISIVSFVSWKNFKQGREEKLRKDLEEEAARQQLLDFFNVRRDKILLAIEHFSWLITTVRGYFSFHDLKEWQQKYSSLYQEIKNKSFASIQLPEKDREAIRWILRGIVYHLFQCIVYQRFSV